MKTAIYIEGGLVQLVLTPENDWEKRALGAFHDKPISAKFFNGSFYPCRGGYITCGGLYPRSGHDDADDASLMILAEVISPTP